MVCSSLHLSMIIPYLPLFGPKKGNNYANISFKDDDLIIQDLSFLSKSDNIRSIHAMTSTSTIVSLWCYDVTTTTTTTTITTTTTTTTTSTTTTTTTTTATATSASFTQIWNFEREDSQRIQLSFKDDDLIIQDLSFLPKSDNIRSIHAMTSYQHDSVIMTLWRHNNYNNNINNNNYQSFFDLENHGARRVFFAEKLSFLVNNTVVRELTCVRRAKRVMKKRFSPLNQAWNCKQNTYIHICWALFAG